MRQTAIGFKTKGLSLEGVLTTPQDLPEPLPALLVCHPHPMLGGDIDNPVVVAICRAADDQGMVSFRFNFRGVGESEGEFSNGVGEQEDLKSALNVLRRWPSLGTPSAPRWSSKGCDTTKPRAAWRSWRRPYRRPRAA